MIFWGIEYLSLFLWYGKYKKINYHNLDISEVFSGLQSGEKGLSEADATVRLKTYGPNQLPDKRKKSALMIFIGQFLDVMIFILAIAAIISAVAGELTDTYII